MATYAKRDAEFIVFITIQKFINPRLEGLGLNLLPLRRAQLAWKGSLLVEARRFINLHAFILISKLCGRGITLRAVGFLMQNNIFSKPLYVIIAVVLVVALLGVGYLTLRSGTAAVAGNGNKAQVYNGGSLPVVSNGDTVGVYYTGTFTNGTQFGSNVVGKPLQFTVGSNEVILGFDQGVLGMKLNETKTITVPANEAYGQINPALIVHVPLSAFGNQTVRTGVVVSENSTSGRVSGIVTAVNATTATINFNPPLAGQTLVFNVKVVSIQKA